MAAENIMEEAKGLLLEYKDKEGYLYQFFETLNVSLAQWNNINTKEIFLHSKYLLALENNRPTGFEFVYILVKNDKEQVVGKVYFQIRRLKLNDSFHSHEGFHFKESVKKFVMSFIDHYVLICGNVMLTGPYGFSFVDGIDLDTRKQILSTAVDQCKQYYNQHKNKKIRTVLFKEFEGDCPLGDCFPKDYTLFQVQPSMALELDSDWNNFDDYLAAFKSKARTRVKRAKKKSASLEFKALSTDDINTHQSRMNELYRSTAEKADFSMFKMNNNYFLGLQDLLQTDLKTFGVFKEDRLIAFYTLIDNDGVADAHFLGYDLGENKEHQVYLNILYQMVAFAIEQKCKRLNLSRTALEIKSSIGAMPHDLKLLIKHDRKWLNRFGGYIMTRFVPQKEWKPRDPFK